MSLDRNGLDTPTLELLVLLLAFALFHNGSHQTPSLATATASLDANGLGSPGESFRELITLGALMKAVVTRDATQGNVVLGNEGVWMAFVVKDNITNRFLDLLHSPSNGRHQGTASVFHLAGMLEENVRLSRNLILAEAVQVIDESNISFPPNATLGSSLPLWEMNFPCPTRRRDRFGGQIPSILLRW